MALPMFSFTELVNPHSPKQDSYMFWPLYKQTHNFLFFINIHKLDGEHKQTLAYCSMNFMQPSVCASPRFESFKMSEKLNWLAMLTSLSRLPGMGVSTVSAARILQGQMEGRSGEETMLAMDTFPFVALSKVTTQHKWSSDHRW